MRTQQDLTFRGLFAFIFSGSVYQDYFFVNFTDYFVPLLFEPAASLSFGQLFALIGTFPELRNVFSLTETRSIREKQIGRRDHSL